MSGISPTSGSTSTLSSVGQSLLNNGTAPNAVPASSTSATGTQSPYQQQFAALQVYDTQELLYASFLSPDQALANADSVFEQAATLLAAPGSQSAAQTAANQNPPSTTSGASSTSTASSSLDNLPSVASILAQSDQEAQQTLTAFANAPVGSSIIDYQA